MLRPIRRLGFRVIQEILRRRNLMVVPSSLTWLHPDHAHRVAVGCAPDIVLDVGANEGQFGKKLRELGYGLRIVSVEPQPEPFRKLREAAAGDSAWDCKQCAVGEAQATLSMHVSQFSPSSSLLPIGKLHVELMPHTAEVEPVTVQVVRLDQLAREMGLFGRRLFLKLDVQGYETSALRGAGDLLRDVHGASVELNFAPLFDGQSAYHEVLGLLATAGLRFVGLTDIHFHPETNDFLWADGIFLRR
jgi:FkbM family methyltransferase